VDYKLTQHQPQRSGDFGRYLVRLGVRWLRLLLQHEKE